LYTYSEATTDDDVNFSGCYWLQDCDNKRYADNNTFSDVADDILPVIRMPLSYAYGVSEEVAYSWTYMDM